MSGSQSGSRKRSEARPLARAILTLFLFLALAGASGTWGGCSGESSGTNEGAGAAEGMNGPLGPRPAGSGAAGTSGSPSAPGLPGTTTTPGAPGTPGAPTGTPPAAGAPAAACKGFLEVRAERLSDRHLQTSLQELLGLAQRPDFRSGAAAVEDFHAGDAAAVTGAVAVKLRDLIETAAGEATAAGKPAARCVGDETACGRAFVDRFGARAFRRPLDQSERDGLMMVYANGREVWGNHAGGIRLVIEAVLQAPSFLYVNESGTAAAGRRKLGGHELATRLALFLRDGLPDDELARAADEGRLATDAGINGEVERLLGKPEVRANLTRLFGRLFQIDRMASVTKAPTLKEFTPELATALGESFRLQLDEWLWKGGGKLPDLLTSRKVFANRAIAPFLDVPAPAGTGFLGAVAPMDRRSGVLTHPALMTIEAKPDESSVVHRGVFVVKELLCFRPPPPVADDLAAGDALKKMDPTERGQAEKRAAVLRCGSCHRFFDGFGISFENYDTLGRHRTTIRTPAGSVPVDASWEVDAFDVKGRLKDAIDLSARLAQSGAVRACMVRQISGYALGAYLEEASLCALEEAARRFASSGGDFLQLVRAVATSPALRERQAPQGGTP